MQKFRYILAGWLSSLVLISAFCCKASGDSESSSSFRWPGHSSTGDPVIAGETNDDSGDPEIAGDQSEQIIAAPHKGKLLLFILAGQSNMSGRGKLEHLPRKELDQAIYVFGNDYRWRIGSEPVDSPTGQVDAISKDPGAGVSPAMAFAREIRQRRPDVAIGLIPCAMGATTMFEWERRLDRTSLYGSCLYRAKQASSMGSLKAILFFQGEWDAPDKSYDRLLAENSNKPEKRPQNRIQYSDSKAALPAGMGEGQLTERGLQIWPGAKAPTQEAPLILSLRGRKGYNRSEPALWAYLFADYVDNMRYDLQIPELPVIFAQIGTNTRPEVYRHWTTVQKAQQALQMDSVSMIQTDDLSLKDSVHFTAASYIRIGKRFAKAYLDLSPK